MIFHILSTLLKRGERLMKGVEKIATLLLYIIGAILFRIKEIFEINFVIPNQYRNFVPLKEK
jgi:hypothetical protein